MNIGLRDFKGNPLLKHLVRRKKMEKKNFGEVVSSRVSDPGGKEIDWGIKRERREQNSERVS